jgi:RHS repeat-associated protein
LSGTKFNEEFIFFNGKRIARRDIAAPSAVHYYFSDHLGSADTITDASGNIQKQSDYFPFGGEVVVTGSDVNNYKFTGKERDTETGNDYFGARYYASNFGRFLVADWAAKPTAVPYAHFGNPQSLNLYSYVENNPTTVGDPDGHGPPDPAAEPDPDVEGVGPPTNRETGEIDPDAEWKNAIRPVESEPEPEPPMFAHGAPLLPPEADLPPENRPCFVDPEVDKAIKFQDALNSQKAMLRGRASEVRVLESIGETKNTKAVSASGGRSIPDFQNSTTVGEIKDTKRVSDTPQLKIQKESAEKSAREHKLFTGKHTKVSDNAARGTNVIRRTDLGPQK